MNKMEISPEENKQLFAAKYKLYLPTEQELIEEIEREKALEEEAKTTGAALKGILSKLAV